MKMQLRRHLRLASISLMALGIASCQNQLTDVNDQAELAKGGSKGKPTSKENPVLEEYWVYPDGTGGNLIHVVGSGATSEVNPGVVFDYFFNGIPDDNAPSDAHYEYFYGGPPAQAVTILPSGKWHVDIPWNGERAPGPYFDGDRFYRNMIGTDVDGAGTDPFAFQLRYIVGGNSVGGDQPQGIIDGGVLIGAAVSDVTSEVHGEQTGVTSYATFKGDLPDGVVFLETVSVGPISCTTVTRKIGRGKNATTERVRSVSADFNIVFGFDGPASIPTDIPRNIVWAEMHFRDVESDEISDRSTVFPSEAEVSGTVTLDLPEGSNSPNIEFVVDYVNPTGPFMMYSYDPDRNSDAGLTTTAGFGGSTWTNSAPSTTVGDRRFPVAATPAVTVTCN